MTDVQREALEVAQDGPAATDAEVAAAPYLEWSDSDEHDSYVNDLVGAATQASADAHEPDDTLALASAAATVSAALGQALDHQWALYTPQDAAVVVSALSAQVAETVGNLRKLVQAVHYVSERGEADLPAMSSALERIGAVADGLEPHVSALAPAVADLLTAPPLFRPSRDLHENLRAVAALLDADVTIVGDDHESDHCTCSLVIARGGETYYLDYGDGGWCLLRERDGVPDADGAKHWINSGGIEIDAKDHLVHPQQLADEVAYFMA